MNFFLNEGIELNKTEKELIMESINRLEESTMIRISADSKRKAAINNMALNIARENQDPMYIKYSSSKKRMLLLRGKIRQKYYSQALARVN